MLKYKNRKNIRILAYTSRNASSIDMAHFF
jgi:hypothetical protein